MTSYVNRTDFSANDSGRGVVQHMNRAVGEHSLIYFRRGGAGNTSPFEPSTSCTWSQYAAQKLSHTISFAARVSRFLRLLVIRLKGGFTGYNVQLIRWLYYMYLHIQFTTLMCITVPMYPY